MWIGPMWDADIAGRITEERALELCRPSPDDVDVARQFGLVWGEDDEEYAAREVRRSVRYIAEAASLMAKQHALYHMDDLPNMAGTGQAPKMDVLFDALHQAGFASARVPDIDPFFATDAPHESLMDIVRGLVPS